MRYPSTLLLTGCIGHAGTPTLDVFPGLHELKDWKPQFPKFAPKDLHQALPRELGNCGVELVRVCCIIIRAHIASNIQ